MAKATSDSVGATSKKKLSVMLVALLSLCASVQAEANFTVSVNRRRTTDLYSLNSNNTVTLDDCGAKPNYLVNEKQCASDEELFSGCRVAIVPMNSTFFIPTAAIDSQYSAIITVDDSSKKHVLIFGFNGTNQRVNSSFCSISSLEVYRGRQQAIEISHQGFSLSDNGSIEIHDHQLAYRTGDYTGELYRMNLSCSGGGLPESGCLFFKVAGNTSTVEDKFNGIVPGTFQPDSDNAQQSTDPTGENITVADSVSTTKILTTFTTTTVTLSPDTVYIAVGGVLFFLIVTVVLGVVAGLLVRRVKHNVITKQFTLSDMTSKSSSKQGPSRSGTSNFKLESPTQEATLSEGMVTEFKEVELDGEHESCLELTRPSVSPTLKPMVPTHYDQDTTVSAQGSAEQLYVCPILSNVCESETANQ